MSKVNLTDLIKETMDYEKFTLVEGNRDVSRPHVQELINSFTKYPELTAARPILVNEKMEIIDGQHTFEALRFLNRPIYYIQQPGLTIAATQLLNSSHRSWRAIDFAKSYAAIGNKQYQDFLSYLYEYELGINPTIAYLQGSQGGTSNKGFRQGLFKIREDREVADQMIGHLQKVAEVGQFRDWHEYNFAIAMFAIQRIPEYSPKRMLEKLEGEYIVHEGSRAGYLKQLEAIYNKKVQLENWLRFF